MDENHTEAREMLSQFVKSIQTLDNQITELKDQKKDIFTRVKDEGFNVKALRSAISHLRKEQKSKEIDLSDEEMYLEIIEGIITPV